MHKLTEKDPPSRSGVCAVCGPVKIYAKGNSWVCATRRKQRTAAWAQAHPEQAKANRAHVSAHRLAGSECVLCGSVSPVPYGRGWACPNTPGAKARATHESAPAKPCLSCKAFGNTDNPVDKESGYCLSCSPSFSYSNWNSLKVETYEERKRQGWEFYLRDELEFVIGFPRDPYELDDQEAVRGWRVLGDGDLRDPQWRDV